MAQNQTPIEETLLYHGTSQHHVERIIKKGIQPRGRKSSVWKVPSRRDLVYLTRCYPIHFAIQATEKEHKGVAIFEVDLKELDSFSMLPDEDAIEQLSRLPDFAGKLHGKVPATMEGRTLYFQERLHQFWEFWPTSLKALGTCAHEGGVPVKALKRVALIPWSHVVFGFSDPTITLMNHVIMGSFYRALSEWLFDGADLSKSDELKQRMQPYLVYPEKLVHEGIIVKEL